MATIQEGQIKSTEREPISGQMDFVGINYRDVRMRDRVVIGEQMDVLVDMISEWYIQTDNRLVTREGRQHAEYMMERLLEVESSLRMGISIRV